MYISPNVCLCGLRWDMNKHCTQKIGVIIKTLSFNLSVGSKWALFALVDYIGTLKSLSHSHDYNYNPYYLKWNTDCVFVLEYQYKERSAKKFLCIVAEYSYRFRIGVFSVHWKLSGDVPKTILIANIHRETAPSK